MKRLEEAKSLIKQNDIEQIKKLMAELNLNQVSLAKLIFDETGHGIQQGTISRILAGEAKEAMIAFVRYVLMNAKGHQPYAVDGMTVQTALVTKLIITNAPKLDTITVYLEDLGPRKGKILIECYGQSWSSFWSGMGDFTVSEFFTSTNDDYLVNCLAPRIETYEPDYERFTTEMRLKVCEMRRDGQVSADLARHIYDIEDWAEHLTGNPYEPVKLPVYFDKEELEAFDFCGFDIPEKLTTEYQYITRIVQAVKAALNAYNK